MSIQAALMHLSKIMEIESIPNFFTISNVGECLNLHDTSSQTVKCDIGEIFNDIKGETIEIFINSFLFYGKRGDMNY